MGVLIFGFILSVMLGLFCGGVEIARRFNPNK